MTRWAWIVMKDDGFLCERCGQSYTMNMPAPIGVFIAAMTAFAKPHKKCKEKKPVEA